MSTATAGARPLRPRAKAARVVALALAGAALAYGTIRGGDDHFPFGPFSMFAFSVQPSGEIRSTYLEADTETGERVRVPLSPRGVGMRRAEIEGQLRRILRDPSLLGELAATRARLSPGSPRYTTLYVVVRTVRLRDGVAAGSSTETVASWRVAR